MQLVFASLAALAFTVGGVFMKEANGFQNGSSAVLFLLLFLVGAAFQAQAMQDAELGSTYVLVLGLETVLAFGFGMAFFGEALTLAKSAAVLLIVCGMMLLRRH